jgi:cyclase
MQIQKLGCRFARSLLCMLAALSASVALSAEPDSGEIDVSVQDMGQGIYLLTAEGGGNMLLSTGEQGGLLVDDHLQQLGDKLLAAIGSVSEQPVRLLVNTHWHFDHTGNNALLGQEGAIIMAHQSVRTRLADGQFVPAFNMTVPPAPPAALPMVTYDNGVTLYWNSDRVDIRHMGAGHTDGDSVVYFGNADIVHMGDLFWNGLYPLVDASSGGSTAGLIDDVAAVLAQISERTTVIPGHGAVGDKADLQAYHDMLQTVNTRILALKGQGKTIEEIKAARPTAEFDAKWGNGLFAPDDWVSMLYLAP